MTGRIVHRDPEDDSGYVVPLEYKQRFEIKNEIIDALYDEIESLDRFLKQAILLTSLVAGMIGIILGWWLF